MPKASKMFKDITHDDILSIVEYHAKHNYETMGNTFFQDKGYSKLVLNNIISYTNVCSSFDMGYKYVMKIIIINNLRENTKIWKYRRCGYCNHKRCNSKLTCCGKNVHIDCATNNNCKCDCENRKFVDTQIVLQKNNKSYSDDNTCSVCMETCELTTQCGHCICKECLDKIYTEHGAESKCPICRDDLINKNERSINEIADFKLNDKVEFSVKVNVTIQ